MRNLDLDTSRWSLIDHAAFWWGMSSEWIRGELESLILRAAPGSRWALRIEARRHLAERKWFG